MQNGRRKDAMRYYDMSTAENKSTLV